MPVEPELPQTCHLCILLKILDQSWFVVSVVANLRLTTLPASTRTTETGAISPVGLSRSPPASSVTNLMRVAEEIEVSCQSSDTIHVDGTRLRVTRRGRVVHRCCCAFGYEHENAHCVR